jgi:hypothetical protein
LVSTTIQSSIHISATFLSFISHNIKLFWESTDIIFLFRYSHLDRYSSIASKLQRSFQ